VANSSHLLRLLHLASPALPIGAFHFSQGLEYAVECGAVKDEHSASEWIEGVARYAIATLDLPILLRLHRAYLAKDEAAIECWSSMLVASRETEELRAEDRHMGRALARILSDLGVSPKLDEAEHARATYVAVFARACAAWSIEERDALETYAWAWAENQTLAAVKLVPLGQTAGQRILHGLVPTLAMLSQQALRLADEDIGTTNLMQTFASARHETQYTRLFRS
jgi:urease accessory protein